MGVRSFVISFKVSSAETAVILYFFSQTPVPCLPLNGSQWLLWTYIYVLNISAVSGSDTSLQSDIFTNQWVWEIGHFQNDTYKKMSE